MIKLMLSFSWLMFAVLTAIMIQTIFITTTNNKFFVPPTRPAWAVFDLDWILFLVHCFGWLTVCSVTLCIVGGRFLQLCAPRALHISSLHQARCRNSFRKHNMYFLPWFWPIRPPVHATTSLPIATKPWNIFVICDGMMLSA